MAVAARKDFHIAIIGGGITGLTLAIALCKRQIPCTIYEQAPAFGEIGAGVGLSRNALKAMDICDENALKAYKTVMTHNKWESKFKVWLDFLDGTAKEPASELKSVFSIEDNPFGQNAVHRAHFVAELEKILPKDIGRFGKRLEHVTKNAETGRLLMEFRDGTTVETDAIVGCDGIKSKVREILVGSLQPSARCSYTYKYAYRGLIPMEEAVAAVGEERAVNSCLWMGPDRHALTFPVNHGKTLNLVAFVTADSDWPSEDRLTLPATREAALEDFKQFSPNVLNLIQLTKSNLDRWGIFDLGDHPLTTFYKERMCLLGDAAHASSPHLGAGAGLCIEDCAFLACLLEDDHVTNVDDLEEVFGAYDRCRRERGQWLVQSSRRAADLYEWRNDEIGKDFSKIEKDVRDRQNSIWGYDLDDAIRRAGLDLRQRLADK